MLKSYYWISRDALGAFFADRTFTKAASLAYYTVFSLAPLLIISIAIAGFFFGADAARGEIVGQLGGLVGVDSARAIEDMLRNAVREDTGPLAAMVGLVTLLIGATSVFAELKDSLDQIWEVPPEKTRGFFFTLRKRVLSFGLILAIGFLLLVSLVFTAAVAALQSYWFLGDAMTVVLESLNFLFSFVLVSAMFGTIYKLLPVVRLAWRDVFVGALVTALLFNIGKVLLGLYLGKSAVASAYGAAGSVMLLLLWVYYSALIFLLGAEFTRSYAQHRGSRQASRKQATAAA